MNRKETTIYFNPTISEETSRLLGGHIGHDLNELISLLLVAIQNVRKESKEASLLSTNGIEGLLVVDLDHTNRILDLKVILLIVLGSKVHQTGSRTFTVVVDHTSTVLEATLEQLDGRITLNLILTSEISIHCGIHLREVNLALHCGSSLDPLRSKGLAVATPGSVELDHPDVLAIHDHALKVVVRQHDHIFGIAGLGRPQVDSGIYGIFLLLLLLLLLGGLLLGLRLGF